MSSDAPLSVRRAARTLGATPVGWSPVHRGSEIQLVQLRTALPWTCRVLGLPNAR